MKISEKIFESFKWIDIENPFKEDLEKITKELLEKETIEKERFDEIVGVKKEVVKK